WSSDVCSSDLREGSALEEIVQPEILVGGLLDEPTEERVEGGKMPLESSAWRRLGCRRLLRRDGGIPVHVRRVGAREPELVATPEILNRVLAVEVRRPVPGDPTESQDAAA